MMPVSWPCPLSGGGSAGEYALTFDRGRPARLLIVPALFDEANRMRRLTVDVMRRLAGWGIDSVLPDLPGCNESLQPLEKQTIDHWRDVTTAAATHFRATHVLGIRGGALLTPDGLPCWHYAPIKGASILRQLIRSRILTAREAGRTETQEGLLESGMTEGLELSGFRLSVAFLRALQTAEAGSGATAIPQESIGGGGLWLRAEPGEDAAQADALASALAAEIGSS